MDERLTRYDTIVFDIGGVLLRFNPEYILQKLLPDDTRKALARVMFGPEHQWGQFDLGKDTNEQIAADIARAAGVKNGAEQVLHVVDYFHTCMDELPLVRELPALRTMGKRMYLLTNYPQPSFSNALKAFPFLNGFDGFVCSADEKLVKPDPAIFRLLCTRYDIKPENALFIDDSAPNTLAAAGVGFNVWNYKAE